jgi:type II secretory pathway pseudopilin PulG
MNATLIVLVVIVVIAIAAVVAFRRFERYRYTDAWRKSELRGWAFGFLMWFGGLFGHRLPPPPQTKVEFASKTKVPEPPASGGAPLSDHAPDDKE